MNRYLVGYELYFFQHRTVEVEAMDKAHALEVARRIVIDERQEDVGGNLRRDTFKVVKKIQPRHPRANAWHRVLKEWV